MALLIDAGMSNWMSDSEIAQEIHKHAPDLDVRTPATIGDASDVTMVALVGLRPGHLSGLPNLRLVQKLGAGVETILGNPDLPDHMRVARLKPDAPAQGIAEWFLAYILRVQRNMAFHEAAQNRAEWIPKAPLFSPDTVVGVLGLGHIGDRTARMLRAVGFKVLGWSRSPKEIDGIACLHGPEALPEVLDQCDHICAILPSTPDTIGLFDAGMLAHMKPGSPVAERRARRSDRRRCFDHSTGSRHTRPCGPGRDPPRTLAT